MHQVGIIQGRLTPQEVGVIQSFPFSNWGSEFETAEKIGFPMIEWVLDDNVDRNPILDSNQFTEIKRLMLDHQITVPTICCDNYMRDSLISATSSVRKSARHVFDVLVNESCLALDIPSIELPLMGEYGLSDAANREEYTKFLKQYFRDHLTNPTKILLEVDLQPSEILQFIDNVESEKLVINYDTGNSALFGYKPDDEIPLYGKFIESIHIKDITLKDYTVPLGKGIVDFDLIFRLLGDLDYKGDFILQAARDKDDIGIAEAYRNFTLRYIDRYLNES